MKKTISLLSLLPLGLLSAAACGSDPGIGDDDTSSDPDAMVDPQHETIELQAGDLAGDQHWTANNTYVLKGQVFLTSGTLTIDAGTTIKGDAGSVLAITKNAKIAAVGTADKPIVFTSSSANPASGDWGGVVMLGKAGINVTGGTNKIEGFPESVGDKISYGGSDDAHDCGTLNYVRIEYAGFELATDNELNGLSLGGCGSATDIDFVQVHLGLDDGIEVFGGDVDLKHIVISQPDDDGLDWDLGWHGKAQFVIVQQKNGRGNRGFEADNNKNDNELTPRSAPEIWNATLIGGDGVAADQQGGMHLRRGTAGHIENVVMSYFAEFAVNVDGTSSVAQYNSNALTVKHAFFTKAAATDLWPANFDVASGNEDDCQTPNTDCFNEAAVIGGDATNHTTTDPMLADPKNLTAPNWKPTAGSPVLTGCGTPPSGGFFDTSATFCGAIGTVDWTAGWTSYPN